MSAGKSPSGGTEADPLIARATPRHDHCGKPGHGVVYLTARAEVDAALMSVSADCDYIDAAVDLTPDEARDLAASRRRFRRGWEATARCVKSSATMWPHRGMNTFAFGFGMAAALACLTVWWATR